MNSFESSIFMGFNPNHTTYFHNILETLSQALLSDLQH
jgi:hypothetical protein